MSMFSSQKVNKKSATVLVTSNLTAHTWSTKCRRKKKLITQFSYKSRDKLPNKTKSATVAEPKLFHQLNKPNILKCCRPVAHTPPLPSALRRLHPINPISHYRIIQTKSLIKVQSSMAVGGTQQSLTTYSPSLSARCSVVLGNSGLV
jgi:hypothetical protein